MKNKDYITVEADSVPHGPEWKKLEGDLDTLIKLLKIIRGNGDDDNSDNVPTDK